MSPLTRRVVAGLAQEARLDRPDFEYAFCPWRRYRFDAAWPERKIAMEQEGGVWIRGRHGRGSGVKKDMEKYTLAALLGWRVLRYEPREILAGAWVPGLRHVMLHEPGPPCAQACCGGQS